MDVQSPGSGGSICHHALERWRHGVALEGPGGFQALPAAGLHENVIQDSEAKR